uniref:Reverse transcriptase domain-containing protein n=1 Tax=Tanacetum cinerariifolium TaxID=118510 RepID=A0A6L2M1D0_TANCI|nr:reverse transcriptase domain-containing protein [Tanacetum cinerariifolium]
MSSEEAEKESTNSDSDDDETHVTGSMVEPSRIKKLKKFDFITKDGRHIHLTEEEINHQKKLEEDAKDEAAKQEREVRKADLVNLLGPEVVNKYYNDNLQVMSSPNHPTSDIEDAFFSSSPNYTPASPDYFSASAKNTSSESLNYLYGLVPIASPTLSLFHDDHYMKVMHAYDTIISPQVPILPPAIVPPSLMLSSIFNPQEFFVLEELLPPIEQAAILQLVANSVAAALEAQAANMAKTDRAVGLIRWFERTELVFSSSNCTKDCKVKLATVRKMEDEFYNLVVKGNDLKTYARRFQELATLCPNMVPNNEKLKEVFIGGLPQSIEGTVTASKPQTLEEAINIAHSLLNQVLKHGSVQGTNVHK